MDREKFLKVLALVETDTDGEALNAARAATRMARAAGFSLGEAVRQIGGGGPAASSYSYVSEIVELRIKISELQSKLYDFQRRDGPSGFEQGYHAGFRAGLEAGTASGASKDDASYEAGRKAGFEEGAASERAATVAAYNRGLRDGRAGVDLAGRPKRRKAH